MCNVDFKFKLPKINGTIYDILAYIKIWLISKYKSAEKLI